MPGTSTARHLFRLWWRRLGPRAAAALLAAAFALLLLAVSRYAAAPTPRPTHSSTYGHRPPALVDITLVHGTTDKGAVCLDGTPPAYHFQPGFGDGAHSWLLHLDGGSWCRNFESCARRKLTNLGSSAHMETRAELVGILSDDQSQNPDFYNWNKVKIRYCDGASFSGDVQHEVKNGTAGFFFRGQRIWEAVMAELLSKGLNRAKQAFLTGCSAGGLSTYIHCDDFRALLPKASTVKCLADGGLFLDVEDISGGRYMRAFYNDVARLQMCIKSSPDAVQIWSQGRFSPDLFSCFFPQEVAKSIVTPMFILNPAYDVWEVEHVLSPEASDPQNLWLECKMDITKCSSKQLEILQGFRKSLLDAIDEFKNRRDWGLFIDSCFIHCQSTNANALAWHSPSAARINNKTPAEAVGDWFFDRREVKEIDCEYPCNPTCYNVVLRQPSKED